MENGLCIGYMERMDITHNEIKKHKFNNIL